MARGHRHVEGRARLREILGPANLAGTDPLRSLPAKQGGLAHHDLAYIERAERRHDQETEGARARDEGALAGSNARPRDGVQSNRERLGERSDAQRKPVGYRHELGLVHADQLGERASKAAVTEARPF
jgi:hypothetical protein